jgi:uncharacterized membrane protein (UPF0182 family)
MRRFPGLLLAAVVLLLVVPSSVRYYTDWLWFQELGYEGIFLRTLNAQLTVFAATFTVVFLFLYFNLRLARGTITRPHIMFGTAADGRAIALETGPLAKLALPAAVVVALGLGVAGARDWLLWLNFFNGVPFDEVDPLFGRDVAFYVFRLPIWRAIQQLVMVTSLLTLIGCGLYYVLSGSFIIESRPQAGFWPRIRLVTSARRHIGLLASLVFLALAWSTWLQVPTTLLTPANAVFGASYVDVHARMPILWVTIFVLVAGAALAVVHGFTRRGWPLPLAVGLYLIITIGGSIYSASVQRLFVLPNELNREQPYLVNNIQATRRAYALDRVEERELSGDAELTAKDIIGNASTIENVRLWDHAPLLQTFAQIQEIRTYYDFKAVDNDRYLIDGKYRQVMLSARELNSESIQNRSWVNERLTFTHGYGLTLGPVNQVTTEGLPVLLIRDLPPVSTASLRVDQPSIYFGELSSDYVLVKTKQEEFHYPKGDDNETTVYDGSGGVSIGSFWRRVLFALRFTDTDILFTNQLTAESRVLYHRRIADRVQLLAPFLSYDADPYPVLSEGRLFWIQDAYTTSPNYPYATPTLYQENRINYMRNSVKIVIDAYHGSTSFYLAEPDDPIAQTIAKVFPGMLQPMSAMSPDLQKHVRYPEDIFRVQASVYQSYHMTNPQVFYNKEDQWQVPMLEAEQGSRPMQPYYTVMRLPGEKHEEFIQMLPFTPRLKENLSAWMVARSDPEQYGRLLVFQFPKQKIIFGPKQIVGRINQDEIISPQVTLWDQQGSRVIWGTLLVIPVNESLLYVRPLYLQSPEGKIPELKQVIVAYQSRIEMAETLTRALARIFGPTITAALAPDRLSSSATSVVQTEPDEAKAPDPRAPAAALDATAASLIAEIGAHWDAAEKALRSGDLATYGAEMKKAREAFDRLERIKR